MNPRSTEAKIARLTREIAEIDEFFYKVKDRLPYAGMLERKRDDMVRSTVLQLPCGQKIEAVEKMVSCAKKSPAKAGLSLQEEPSNVTFTIDENKISAANYCDC